MLEDLVLIKRIREGDIDAFETLFRKYYSPLLFYSAGITGSRETAEDIIQELFYSVWKKKESYNIIISVKSYLYKAVLNSSLQIILKRKKDSLHRESSINTAHAQTYNPTPSQDAQYTELKEIISKSIASMPHRRADIFRMHRFDNLKYKEIAEKLSISVKTVEAEMTKALKTLKKEIEIYHQLS